VVSREAREAQVFVPGADDKLQPKDTVVVIAPGAARKALRKLFSS
jgi:Trk K+ transport system NAD-binding subunit